MNDSPVETGGVAGLLERAGPAISNFVQLALDQWVLSLLWVGLFIATFLLMRMLVTRWGDSQVTMKAVVLSLLVHLLAGLWTTTVHIARESFAAQEGNGIAIRRVIVEDPGSGTPGQGNGTEGVAGRAGKLGDGGFPSAAPEMTRLERPSLEPTPLDVSRQDLSPIETPAVKMPDVTAWLNQINTVPQTIKSVMTSAKIAEKSSAPINEETATARPEAQLPAATPTRQSLAPANESSTEISRQPNQRVTEDLTVNVTPAPQSSPTAVTAEPSVAVTRPEVATTEPNRRAVAAPATIPNENTGTEQRTADNPPPTGVAQSTPFARIGRPTLPQATTPDAPERLRTGGTASEDATPDSRTLVDARINARGSFSPEGMLPAPQIARPDGLGNSNKAASRVPATYRLRNLPQRNRIAVEMGATEDSERAVELSLQWLARHQNIQGFWDPDGFSVHCPAGDRCTALAMLGRDPPDPFNEPVTDPNTPVRQRSGMDADAGVTGLAILAFLGAGYTHEEGTYADQLDRALRWLIRQQRSDGYLGGKAGRYAQIYCHGMATIAIGEAYGMTNDPTLREPLSRAIKYIVSLQNSSDGGWRYEKGQELGDVSIFGWQLLALKSAATAGLDVPGEAWEGAIDFLKRNGQGKYGGLAAYRFYRDTNGQLRKENPKPSMTAEALFSRQILGMKRTNPASTEAVEFLMQHLPRRATYDLYYWYYGTLAMYHHGGAEWKKWNDALRETLVSDQRTTGHATGSWDARSPWGDYGGRVFSTAMSTLCLEVYYRFLPLHQTGETPGIKE